MIAAAYLSPGAALPNHMQPVFQTQVILTPAHQTGIKPSCELHSKQLATARDSTRACLPACPPVP